MSSTLTFPIVSLVNVSSSDFSFGQKNWNIPKRSGLRSVFAMHKFNWLCSILTLHLKSYSLNVALSLYRVWPESHHSKIPNSNISLHWKYKAAFYPWEHTYFRFLITESLSHSEYLHYYPYTWSRKSNFKSQSCMALWIDRKSQN